MTRRTNNFQQLIAYIYEKIVPAGGTVTESGMVMDKDAKVLREVDILVEHRLAGHPLKIAIECRDRSRKDTVEWIDSLIGKIGSLDVNKIVAISSRGFAKTAIQKARVKGIDTLTFEEAVEADWEKYFFRPGIAIFSDPSYRLQTVQRSQEGNFVSISGKDREKHVIVNGKDSGLLQTYFTIYFESTLVNEVHAFIKKNIPNLYKSYSDLQKTTLISVDRRFPAMILKAPNGDEVDASVLRFIITCDWKLQDVATTHHRLNQSMLSVGVHSDFDGKYEFRILQDADTQKVHADYSKWV